jgi:hypothetical protein
MEKENGFSFWKNLVFAIVFFTVTPLTLGASLYSLLSLNKNLIGSQTLRQSDQTAYDATRVFGAKIYASLPTDFPSVSGKPQTSDARAEIIKQYLLRYNSPLSSYADYIVKTADEFKIDYRLTTAIAQQESNLCKVIPPKTFNCWGWGIHTEGTLGFSSFEEGIKAVTKGIAQNYIAIGLDTPEKIMSKYTPLSNGSWAKGVEEFLNEME